MMEESGSLFQRFLRPYEKGEVVFEEGSQGSEMFIVHKGKVRLAAKGPKGAEQTLAILGPGEFFGEMALIDNSPRSASATADAEGTELIVLDRPKFSYMVQQVPAFCLAIM